MTARLLTSLERHTVQDLGDVWGNICSIVGTGSTREADLAEAVVHIHALQHLILAQAAARAYPDEFRALGWTIGDL